MLVNYSLVIMSLVDQAHGKQRHVPYRDSRLTFLLQVANLKYNIIEFFSFDVFVFIDVLFYPQDSLGGNSKTMIIANVSPSVW